MLPHLLKDYREKKFCGLDVIRALNRHCVCLWVTQIWQIYILIFILQSASAAFTPTFQAMIPDVLPIEEEYTNALSLSRLAYDLENIISPMLAGLLLTVMSYHKSRLELWLDLLVRHYL